MAWSDIRHHYEEGDFQEPDWKLLSDTKHTARTTKTCAHCESLIEPRQVYRKIAALDEGKFTLICSHEDRDTCVAGVEKAKAAEEDMVKAQAAWWDEQHQIDAEQEAANGQA